MRSNDQNVLSSPRQARTWTLPAEIRYFSNSNWFAVMGAEYVVQDVERKYETENPDKRESFYIVNAGLGYRLPKGRGVLRFEVRNLLNKQFRYLDDDYRTGRLRVGSYVPDRTILVRLNVAF